MFWNILMLCAGIIFVVLLWICIYDSNRFVIRHYEIKNRKLKGQLRAVVLADLHNKKFGRDNLLLLEEIDGCKPDVIWIAGDIPTAVPGAKLEPAIDFVTALAKKYPVFYGNGNHEHRLKLYPAEYGDMAERYAKGLAAAGVFPLVNAYRGLAEYNVSVYGAEIGREYYQRFENLRMDKEYLNQLLGKPNPESFNVLLAHNPDYFPVYAKWGADLVLSGHIHGGMVRIPGWRGVVSPSVRLFPKYDGGRFEEKGSTMLLSRGLGMHTIPVRLFNPGELVVVDLMEAD